MKATEQYFPVVRFIILYKVFLTFESVQTNATMQYFFVMLYKVIQMVKI